MKVFRGSEKGLKITRKFFCHDRAEFCLYTVMTAL